MLTLVFRWKNILGMSVVGSDFEELKQFNLAEIYDPTPKPSVEHDKPSSAHDAEEEHSTLTSTAIETNLKPTSDGQKTNSTRLDGVDGQHADSSPAQSIPNHAAAEDQEAVLTNSQADLAPPADEADSKT